jgi:phosphatidylinositol alpha-1,6-mannosyltransferase
MNASLLVTNDFPPKIGGIQSYLYELWRRLPSGNATVLTTPYDGAAAWDARQQLRVVRTKERLLLPTRSLTERVRGLAREVGAGVVFVDPMFPVGVLAPRLDQPYVVVVHGAEITVYGRLWPTRPFARRVLRGAAGIIAAGDYVARECVRAAGRPLATRFIPPGVDPHRFVPLDDDARRAARARLGLDPVRKLVVGVSRLVPRKGFDTVLDAVVGLPDVQVVIAGAGRDRARLEARARRNGVDARFLGRVPDDDLPVLYGVADVFTMLCRDRWGGLEAEGFGIVFLEAAACAVPSVAGRSGGSHEAVVDGETGFVVDPRDVGATRAAIERLLADDTLRACMGAAARRRVEAEYSYDHLVQGLAPIADGDLSALDPFG